MAKEDDIDSIIKEITKGTVKYKQPLWQTKLVYDSSAETLEPIYFWILDFMEDLGLEIEKITDNFTASPGSGYFSDMSQKIGALQDRAMNFLRLINDIVKAIVVLISELKVRELKIRDYDDMTSENRSLRGAAILSLKRRWSDEVDIRKGRGALVQMTQQAFPGIMDAFMICNSQEDVDNLDVNDTLKRMLKPRVKEWQDWVKKSEEAERKYFRIEKGYLKAQVNNLRLYARWARPYLKAAEQLRMKDSKSPSLVNAFNTMILELSLLGKKSVNAGQEAIAKNLPEKFKKLKMARKYYSCIFIDFLFRGIPRPSGQKGHYTQGGRVDVNYRAYALNEDEIALMNKKMEEDDMEYILGIAEGISDTGLNELKDDIESFLKKEEKEKKEEDSEDINPFFELLKGFASLFKAEKKEGKTEEEKINIIEKEGIMKDSYEESLVRSIAEKKASDTTKLIFDLYKKGHGMVA